MTISDPTLPEHGTSIALIEDGYCARIVPAMSAPPYPHLKHKNAIIFISSFFVILYASLLCYWK
jgi:hypothetical protein